MQQRTGALLVLASAVAFGVMPIFGKLAFEAGVGVATLLFVRFAIAAPVLWAARRRARRAAARAARRGGCGRWRSARVGYAMQAGPVLPRAAAHGRLRAVPDPLQLPRAGDGGGDPPRARAGQPAASRRPRHRVGRARAGAARARARAPSTSPARALGAGAALTYTTYILVSDGVTAQPRAAAAGRAGDHRRGASRSASSASATGSLDFGFDPAGWLWLGARGAGLDRRRGRAVLQRHEPRRPVDGGDPLDARAAGDRRARVPDLRRGARRRAAARRAGRARRGGDRQPAAARRDG